MKQKSHTQDFTKCKWNKLAHEVTTHKQDCLQQRCCPLANRRPFEARIMTALRSDLNKLCIQTPTRKSNKR